MARRIVLVFAILPLSGCATPSRVPGDTHSPPPVPSTAASSTSSASTTAPSVSRALASDRRVYSRADLDALAAQSAYPELGEHLEDLAPAERDDAWRALVARAVTGYLRAPPAPTHDLDLVERADDLVERYPSLRSSKEFLAVWGDIAVRAAGEVQTCPAVTSRGDPCARLVATMAAVSDPKKTIAAARSALRAGQRPLAMAFYRVASASESVCDDDEALAVMLQGLERSPDSPYYVDAKAVQDRCRNAKGKAKR